MPTTQIQQKVTPLPQVGPTNGPYTQNQQAIMACYPLDGDTGQTVSRSSAWTLVPPGASLQLALAVTALTGTFSAAIETCNQINTTTGVNVDPPRLIGEFLQQPSATLPSTTPMRAVGGGYVDNYIRVVSDVGEGSSCAWQITGNIIASPYATQR
jgi:hypothetical protein